MACYIKMLDLIQATKLQKIWIFFRQLPALCKYQVYHGYSKRNGKESESNKTAFISLRIPLNTGRKLNKHITCKRPPRRLANVICRFNLCRVYSKLVIVLIRLMVVRTTSRVFYKRTVLKISQYWQESTCVGVSF